MFENFENAKVIKKRGWASILLTVSVIVHGVLFAALLIRSFWMIKQLEPPKRENTLAVAPPPPPPPKGNPGHKMKDQPKELKPKKRKVLDTVQPVKVEQKVEDPSTNELSDDPNATPDGEANGTGIDTGVTTEAPPPPPPPPPPPAAPTIVAAQMLQGNRISGDPQIHPDESTEIEISRSGKTRLITSAKLCLDKSGVISSVSLVKSSGFPAYDDKIRREMNTWRYKPWTVNGTAVPVCTAITFIYSVQH